MDTHGNFFFLLLSTYKLIGFKECGADKKYYLLQSPIASTSKQVDIIADMAFDSELLSYEEFYAKFKETFNQNLEGSCIKMGNLVKAKKEDKGRGINSAQIEKFVQENGFKIDQLGFKYISTAVKDILEEVDGVDRVVHHYGLIADRHNTTGTRVERAIRHSIETNPNFVGNTNKAVINTLALDYRIKFDI